MSKFKKVAPVIFIILLFTINQATASTIAPKSEKPLCRLEVQNAHLSKTLLKHHKITAVKVNVLSVCNVEQTQVLITLEIHKKGEFGDHTYGSFTNDQSSKNNSGVIVKLQDKYVVCLNSKLTKWFGIAYSKAFINGKWQYAGRTQSEKIEPLDCGT